jgi:3-hydroxyisobutyrate dehydrogenase
MPSAERVGFIGLGRMGRLMVPRLARAGFRLTVFDLDPRAVAAAGVPAAKSLRELGRASDIVVAMLPDGGAVARAIAGEPLGAGDRAAAGLRPGAVVVDMGASAPSATRRLGRWLARRGIALVDAPVSAVSGRKSAAAGTLTVMAGGDDGAIARCMPVFRVLGRRVFKIGDLGAGHAVKAFQNYISAATLAAVIESLLACKRFGIDPGRALDALNASAAGSAVTRVTLPKQVLSGAFASGFPLGYMVKDVRAAVGLARELGVKTPFASRCLELWSEALRALGPGADYTEYARYMESRTGDAEGTVERAAGTRRRMRTAASPKPQRRR